MSAPPESSAPPAATVTVSADQLFVTARRALEGIGFPYGAYDEGAELVLTLEHAGIGGLQRLLAVLPTLDRTGFPIAIDRDPAHPTHFTGHPAGGIALAPAVMDWCRHQCTLSDTPLQVRVTAGDGDGAWYVAAASPAPGWCVEVRWNENDHSYIGRRHNANLSFFHSDQKQPDDAIQITCTPTAPPPPSPPYRLHHSPDNCHSHRHHCLNNGTTLNAAHWQTLRHYAKRVLVPATAESTATGAGGGDAND